MCLCSVLMYLKLVSVGVDFGCVHTVSIVCHIVCTLCTLHNILTILFTLCIEDGCGEGSCSRKGPKRYGKS